MLKDRIRPRANDHWKDAYHFIKAFLRWLGYVALRLWSFGAIKYMVVMSFFLLYNNLLLIRNHLVYGKQLMQCFTGKLRSGNRNNLYIEKWGSLYNTWTPHFLIYGLFLLHDFSRRDSMILEFLGPPIASGQGLCGFNKGRSLVVKSSVKSLVTPTLTELWTVEN